MAELVKEYYSGQGMVYAAPYVGGVVQTEKMRWIGNVPALELSFETDTEEHKESHSGTRQKDLVLRKELSAAFSLTMEDFPPTTWQWHLWRAWKLRPAARLLTRLLAQR